MADWEPLAGFFSAIAALITWAPWYGDLLRVNRLAGSLSYRLVLGLTPPACLLFLLACLEKLAAKAVQVSVPYTLLYMALGAAWLGISSQLFAFLGVSARDDVLERRNLAALIAVVGAIIGITLCFAGGNIGEGPGVQAVIASAGTATGSWFALWLVLESLTGHAVSERITVERDAASGTRLAGLLVANGVILGAGVAGDWIPSQFLHDFVASTWPALVLTVVAILVERVLRFPSSARCSLLISSCYLLVALVWVLRRGIEA